MMLAWVLFDTADNAIRVNRSGVITLGNAFAISPDITEIYSLMVFDCFLATVFDCFFAIIPC